MGISTGDRREIEWKSLPVTTWCMVEVFRYLMFNVVSSV
jgi:hypothetical protein